MLNLFLRNVGTDLVTFAVAALVISLVYRVDKYVNFALILAFILLPYFVYEVMTLSSWPVALIAGSGVALFTAFTIYRLILFPLQKLRSSANVLMLASLGIFIAGQNTISLFFGDHPINLRFASLEKVLTWGSLSVPVSQLIVFVVGVLLFASTSLLLLKTEFGRYVRALAENPMRAKVLGVPTVWTRKITYLLSSFLAGAIGLVQAWDSSLNPRMGLPLFMIGLVVMVVGGGRSLKGLLLAAMALAILRQGTAWLISSHWQEAATFILLLIVLLVRHRGFSTREVSF